MTMGEVTRELVRVADALEEANAAGLTAGELWGGIVVPLFLGLVTVGVAVFGLVWGHRANASLDKERQERADLAHRLRYAEEVRGWAQEEVFRLAFLGGPSATEQIMDITHRARMDGLDSLDRLVEQLIEFLEEVPPFNAHSGGGEERRMRAVRRLMQEDIRAWSEDPSTAEGRGSAIRRIEEAEMGVTS